MNFSTEFNNIKFSHTDRSDAEKKILYTHCHSEFEIIYAVKGNAGFVVENQKFLLQNGSIIVIKPSDYHYLELYDDSLYERYVLTFHSSCIPSEIYNEFVAHIDVISGSRNKSLKPFFENIESFSEYANSPPLLYSFFVQLIYTAVLGRKKTKVKTLFLDDTTKKIISYIDKNILNKITLDDIAESLFVSKSTLCHAFKSSMKISIMQYVKHKKILYANELLASGKKAGEVSFLCGFDDYTLFFRAFKKILGKSPSDVYSGRQ